jgi:hypothetical protein
MNSLLKKLRPNKYISEKQEQFLKSKGKSHLEFVKRKDVNSLFIEVNNGLLQISKKTSQMKYCKIIQQTQEYYVGLQISYSKSPLEICCFRNLMVIDWDNLDINEIYKLIPDDLVFKIYKTTNGYHGYCISQTFDAKELSTQLLMKQLKCDPWYIAFTFNYGFVVRICKKRNDELFIEKYIDIFGNQSLVNLDLSKLVEIKDDIIYSESESESESQ